MRTIALLLFAASAVHGAEPRFQVENKTTPFTVVNKTAPKNYTPPPCAQCNTGNNQCACPLHYGSCRCGEVVKAQPVEVRPAPFPAGYPGFRHPGSQAGTPVTTAPDAGTFPRPVPAPGYRLAPEAGFTGMRALPVGRLSGGIVTSGGCLTGG